MFSFNAQISLVVLSTSMLGYSHIVHFKKVVIFAFSVQF